MMFDEQDAIEELFDFAQHPMAARDAEALMFRSAFASVFQNAANARWRVSKRGKFMRSKGQARRRRMPRNVVPLPNVSTNAPPKSAWDARQEEIAAIVGADPDASWKRGKGTNPFVDCGNSTEVVVTALERCTVLDRMSRSMLSRVHARRVYDDGLSRGGEFSRARKPTPQPSVSVVRAHRKSMNEGKQLALLEGR